MADPSHPSGSAVLDAHIHFWSPERLDYPWLTALPQLRRTIEPADVPVGAVPVESMIFVEADCTPAQALAEVDWVLSLSSPDRPIVGVVGSARLERSGVGEDLDALQRRPEVKGVRRLLQDAGPDLWADPAFVHSVRSLGRRELTFDLCVRHHQLAQAAALVESCPEVTFVLDHVGKPRVRPVPERSWLRDMQRLAAQPNIRCKLSGLTSEVLDPLAGAQRPGLFQPYLDHALQSFGPTRCMFGSDWPVCSLTTTYEGWFEQVTEALMGFSALETAQVLSGTATETYRLGQDRPAAPGRRDRPEEMEHAWH